MTEWFYLTLVILYVPLLLVTVHLWVDVKAMKNSTHSVQYMPIDTTEKKFEPITEDVKKAFQDDGYGSIV